MAAAMDYEILPFLSLKSYCIPIHLQVINLKRMHAEAYCSSVGH